MSSPDPEMMQGVAAQCVRLVGEEFGRELDWSLASLGVLDDVCAELVADGPLAGQRLELWAKLAGAYTGEVTIRAYGGRWVIKDGESGPLASFARVLPVISEQARRRSEA